MQNCKIHPKSNIEGKVNIGENVSVLAFASIRGDEAEVNIGDNSNIQESVVIHGETSIGNNVTVGHGAIVHGAKVGNNVLIGMNCTILDGVTIGNWSIIAAGTLIPPNTKIPSESLVMGHPGKIIRTLTAKDKKLITNSYKVYCSRINS